MNEDQLRIAAGAVADVVRDAISSKDRPTAEDLKKLAEDVAEAIAAGFAKLQPVVAGDPCGRLDAVRAVFKAELQPGGLLSR